MLDFQPKKTDFRAVCLFRFLAHAFARPARTCAEGHIPCGTEWGVVQLEPLPKAAYLEGQCRGVVQLEPLPKAAYLEGQSRGVVQLELVPKATYLEGRCGGVVRLELLPKATSLEGRC